MEYNLYLEDIKLIGYSDMSFKVFKVSQLSNFRSQFKLWVEILLSCYGTHFVRTWPNEESFIRFQGRIWLISWKLQRKMLQNVAQ